MTEWDLAYMRREVKPQPEPVAWRVPAANAEAGKIGHIYAEQRELLSYFGRPIEPLYATPPAAPANRLTLNYAQAVQLMAMYADDADCEITLSSGEGHSGPGIYAHYSEYPEEGAQLLYPSEKVAPHAAAPAPAVPAVCDGGTCGLGGYCANCPKQSAAPAVPLTDEQFADIVADASLEVDLAANPIKLLAFARAVLKAHGIGGGK